MAHQHTDFLYFVKLNESMVEVTLLKLYVQRCSSYTGFKFVNTYMYVFCENKVISIDRKWLFWYIIKSIENVWHTQNKPNSLWHITLFGTESIWFILKGTSVFKTIDSDLIMFF